MKRKVIALVGPTACGKTALSLALGRRLPIEIVCMDSMQVYRGMDIGTAKPTLDERAQAAHHMLDVVDAGESYSVARYRAEAGVCVAAILERGRVPVLVGGTGMYLRALSLPMGYGGAGGDEALRRRYEEMARLMGREAVHRELGKVDGESARRLHPNDLRRVVRALEVYETTGVPLSRQVMPSYEDGEWDILPFMPVWEKETLHARIDARTATMVRDGLLDEVRGLLQRGVAENAQSMQGIGYKEMLGAVKGQRSVREAEEEIRLRTRQYAKRQLTWFRADARVVPLAAQKGGEAMLDTVCSIYSEKTR